MRRVRRAGAPGLVKFVPHLSPSRHTELSDGSHRRTTMGNRFRRPDYGRPLPGSKSARLWVERLEARDVPATINVSTLNDLVALDGQVSLREAIESVNAGANTSDVAAVGPYGSNDAITFAGLAGTITLTGNLPNLTKSVSILGNTGAGFAGAPVVTVDGNNAVTAVFAIFGPAVTVRSLAVVRSRFDGILVAFASSAGAVIAGNHIGVNAAGTAAAPNGDAGVRVTEGATNVTVGGTAAADRNVISGNLGSGVVIDGSGGTTNVLVRGNYIGTDAAGTAPIGNFIAVWVTGSSGNTVGGAAAGTRNIISGNDRGVWIDGPAASNNVVAGNYIGTDASGTADLGNTGFGVAITGGSGNTVGGTYAGAGNVISGNDQFGDFFHSGGFGVFITIASNTVVAGNFIGTDATGTTDLGNTIAGVVISRSSGNT